MLKFKQSGTKTAITETESFLIGCKVKYKDMIGIIKQITSIEYWIKWESMEGITIYPKDKCKIEIIKN